MTGKKRVIVTGATAGIGFRLARLFAGQGADVLATGRRTKQSLENWPSDIRYLQADQTDPSVSSTIAKAVEAAGWSCIEYLVLNAGIGSVGDPASETPARIQETLQVNLVSPMLILHALAEKLEAARPNGKVTLIGSTARRGAPQFASYAASKAGLAGFARALASEWQDRIAVQVIHPGPTATDMHAKAGLALGNARRFFVDPDRSARRIYSLIQGDRSIATVSIGPRELVSGIAGSLRR